MEWIGLNQLRTAFFDFFKNKGHMLLESYPLVPKNDNSLLLINSGMAPMKNWFLGKETPPSRRIVTCQKCIRTPDIDLVGQTARHGTFFEMLGNFSFGDYFKHEATKWAWEFVTCVLKMPQNRLYVTVYENDDETYDIWKNDIGISEDHISRLGKEDNFWEIGSGPCGPCSEIYFDRGEKFGCGRKNCGPGCECDRFVEFWNLVFSQFDNDGNGTYTCMKNPNIDTGMGLERLACIMQGVDNLFEIDTIREILAHVCEIAKVRYGESLENDVSIRIITDHLRSAVFLISDGVIPSNEGRGYVLRRLIRRAHRNGKKLGIDSQFLGDIAQTVAEKNREAYKELETNLKYIKQVLFNEQTSFEKILNRAMGMLMDLIKKADSIGYSKISAQDAFKLCDTYGLPFDMLKDVAREKGAWVDENGFWELMKQQQERARNAVDSNKIGWSKSSFKLPSPPTKFLGYDCLKSRAILLHIFKDGQELNQAVENQRVDLIFDQTPFYAQSGGQIGDSGTANSDGFCANITNCEKLSTGQFVHSAQIISGSVKKGQTLNLEVDRPKREAISRNHTAAHILQAVLIDVLGSHVHQAGQLIDQNRIRFDFNHFEALTDSNIAEIERKINDVILGANSVETREMKKDQAQKLGAIALFGEKYGDWVRVVKIGDLSMEFCGGTHVDNTAKLGLFKIMSESSVGSGIRRIEAKTGYEVLKYINSLENILNKTCECVKVKNKFELCEKIYKLNNDFKDFCKKNENLKLNLVEQEFCQRFKDSSQKVKNLDCVLFKTNKLNGKLLKSFGDFVKSENPNLVAAVCAMCEKKLTLMVICGKNAVKSGVDAGKVARELASLAGGKGGGRKDLAMAGLPSAGCVDLIRQEFIEVVKNNIV